MGEFDVTEKAEIVITEKMEREERDYCKWSWGDDFNEQVFQECLTAVVADENEELQAIAKFYDDEIARLSDKLYGLEPEEPEPVVN